MQHGWRLLDSIKHPVSTQQDTVVVGICVLGSSRVLCDDDESGGGRAAACARSIEGIEDVQLDRSLYYYPLMSRVV